jgi:serine/threonine-protein kinase
MKTSRTPVAILSLLYLFFLGYLLFSSGQLPDLVATHFDGSGRPNGWMSRSSHLLFTLVLGLAFPLFVVAILFVVRFLPDSIINIPHRDYWLAAGRRADTFAYLFRHSLWFACIGVSFVTSVHYLIVQANAQRPAQLSAPWLLGMAGCFLVSLAFWGIFLILHFRRAA